MTSREDAGLDCPRPDCFGWLINITGPEGAKLRCSDPNCRQTTIFSKHHSLCAYCQEPIYVGDVLTHVDSPSRTYPLWVHVTCLVNPPQDLPKTCSRCGKDVKEKDAVEDSTGILHTACLPANRRRAMESGAPVPTILSPKLKKKPIDFSSPGATTSSSQDDA